MRAASSACPSAPPIWVASGRWPRPAARSGSPRSPLPFDKGRPDAMAELFIELRSEEIPARMQRGAAEQLARRLLQLVHGLGFTSIGEDSISTYATPRRLAGVVRRLPPQQPDVEIERRGPRVDAPAQALEGFLRANGLSSADQCERRDT